MIIDMSEAGAKERHGYMEILSTARIYKGFCIGNRYLSTDYIYNYTTAFGPVNENDTPSAMLILALHRAKQACLRSDIGRLFAGFFVVGKGSIVLRCASHDKFGLRALSVAAKGSIVLRCASPHKFG